MTKLFLTLFFLVGSKFMIVSQINLENLKITDKIYFSCYNNPFHWIGLNNIELQTYSKLYGEDSILLDMNTVISFSETFDELTMVFSEKHMEVQKITFVIIQYEGNKIRLRIPDVNIELHKALNCSKFIDDYFFYIDKRELFYNDKKILSWN